MSDISTWTPDAAGMLNVQPPDGFPEGMAPGQVNDSSREIQAAVRRQHEGAEWIDWGHSVTRITNTQFQVLGGNFTSIYSDTRGGRRVRLTDASTLYGTITNSTYSAPNTVVDVALDSGALTASLSAAAVGIVNSANSSLGECAFVDAGTGIDRSANQLNLAFGKLSSVANPDTQNGTVAMRRGSVHEEIDLLSLSGGIAGSAENLVLDGGVSQANRIVTVAADLVILRSTNGAMYPVRDVAVQADITNSGVGGLDTGTPQPGNWYYLYVITNRSSVGAIFSTARKYNVTQPSGWDYMGLVGAAYYIDDSLRFRNFIQHGKVVAYADRYLRRDGAVATNVWELLGMGSAVPQNANRVSVTLNADNSRHLGVAPFSDGRGGFYMNTASGGASNYANALEVARDRSVSVTCPIFSGRDLWTFSNSSPLAVHVTGYELT